MWQSLALIGGLVMKKPKIMEKLSIGSTLSIIILVAAAITGSYSTFVTKSEAASMMTQINKLGSSLDRISKRIDKGDAKQHLRGLQQRKWRLQDRFGEDCGKVKNECRDLQADIEQAKRDLRKF